MRIARPQRSSVCVLSVATSGLGNSKPSLRILHTEPAEPLPSVSYFFVQRYSDETYSRYVDLCRFHFVAGVRRSVVDKRGPLVMSVDALGIVQPNETQVARVNIKTEGWVDQLFVNYVGQVVSQGDPLLRSIARTSFTHPMGEGLLVPTSAVLRTGERDIAYRVEPGDHFVPVAVKISPIQFGDRFHVLEGLEETDQVVTSARLPD